MCHKIAAKFAPSPQLEPTYISGSPDVQLTLSRSPFPALDGQQSDQEGRSQRSLWCDYSPSLSHHPRSCSNSETNWYP